MPLAADSAPDRLLVVEDEPVLQKVLADLLRREGFDVDAVDRGADVSPAIRRFRPDLAILDLGLPDMNGFDVLRRIRSETDLPVIVLSGRDEERDRVLGLELGADDYVVKPFMTQELVARVRTRLRGRRPAATATPVGDSSLHIDPTSRSVVLGDRDIELTATEFDLLAYFARSPRQVFSREQLLAAVWNSSSEWQSDNTVTEYIHRLRTKIGPERFVTVRGVGYRFEPQLT